MVIGISYLLGIPSAINLGFLANQDFVWGLALMISGAFVTFAVLRYGITRLREEELTVVGDQDWVLGSWWDKILGTFVPFAAGILLLWWLYLSATVYSPDDWYNPFRPFSVMTCLLQWGIALGLFILYNNRIVNQFESIPEMD
jgi:NSS family neurotransmitter:Na+ symporter